MGTSKQVGNNSINFKYRLPQYLYVPRKTRIGFEYIISAKFNTFKQIQQSTAISWWRVISCISADTLELDRYHHILWQKL